MLNKLYENSFYSIIFYFLKPYFQSYAYQLSCSANLPLYNLFNIFLPLLLVHLPDRSFKLLSEIFFASALHIRHSPSTQQELEKVKWLSTRKKEIIDIFYITFALMALKKA